LGPIREKLLEYQQLTALKFEIQVRTVLQHAWAELAHDRSFKFSPGLPPAIQRRLNLYAGMLEIVDGGFDSISKEIDDYVRAINSKSIGEISSSEIDRVSIEKFLELLVADNGLNVEKVDIELSVIEELKSFGVSKIDDLRSMVSKEYISCFKGANKYTNYI
jgi:hypothetical protein